MTSEEPETGDPRVDAVVSGATVGRDDVGVDEAQERARTAVDDLDEASVNAFTVPLAVNRVRDELNDEHGPPGDDAPGDDAPG